MSKETKDVAVEPTHWMDDRGLVCSAEFMRSDKAHGDYQLAYNIPCVKKGRKFVKLPMPDKAVPDRRLSRSPRATH